MVPRGPDDVNETGPSELDFCSDPWNDRGQSLRRFLRGAQMERCKVVSPE
jgi:hypothetical protein